MKKLLLLVFSLVVLGACSSNNDDDESEVLEPAEISVEVDYFNFEIDTNRRDEVRRETVVEISH